MVIPVNTARQCLTPEASRTLDDAVNIAHRRCHAQTTSLHVISAFLSLPSSSILRDACTRTRNTAYSPRVQFKALELCFGVALDRLPASSHKVDEPEPPISNSLMAAIKRSQANQRRNPETFHLYQMQLQQQQQQQQSSSLSCVKVELQQFLLSILDDPVVSRVFGEAGFRSYEIKFAIVRPSPSLLRYSNSPYAPLFLCNLTGSDYEMGRRSFSFPFSGFSEYSEKEHNCRKIAEILSRKKGRNPLLVGVCAKDAIQSFTETLKSDKGGSFFLPVEISGLSFISIEKEVSEFITHQAGCEGILGSRFQELDRLLAESCSGPGVVVSFGDLKSFIIEGSVVNATSYVISKLTKLLELHSGNLWLMGAATNYEMYSRFLTKFPSAEKDLDLQLLPINSLKPSMGGYYSRPHSLMESFVPLGGFFSTPSNLKYPLGSTFQSVPRCHLCNEKYEQEVSASLKGGSPVPVANQYQASLPLWLQTAELTTSKGLDVSKAKDDTPVLNTQVTGLQTKWNEICRQLHHRFQMPEGDVKQVGSQVPPRIVGFPFVTDKKHKADNDHSSSTNAPPNKMGPENESPSMSVELQTTSPETTNMSIRDQVASFAKNESSLPKLNLRPSDGEHLQREGLWSPPCSLSNILVGHASPSSATSVTTDLGLGTLYSSTCLVPKKPSSQAQEECLQGWSLCQPAVSGSIPIPPAQSPPFSGTGLSEQFDPRDFKTLLRGLKELVGRQDEAIHAISRTIACCRTGKERRRGLSLKGDVWFSFLGPDYVAKKKLAVALAEIIFGDRQSLICVDLASQDGFSLPNIIFDCQEINVYDENFRGKTVVDYIAGEIKKNPLSVVFLENVEKADLLVQKCLFQAIRTGKFSDTHGREIGINNVIFIVSTGVMKGTETLYSRKEPNNFFSEEKILEAQAWQIKILIRNGPEGTTISQKSNVLVSLSKCSPGLAYLNKRKLIDTANRKELSENLDTAKRSHKASNRYLDLNQPIQDSEATETDFGPNSTGSISENNSEDWLENSEAWLENFFHLVDEAVIFEPYDFDALADELLKKISESFQNTIGHKGLLEIDSKVMEQILAAAWLSDKRRVVEYWVEQVLVRSFMEIQEKHSLKAGFVLKLVTCEGLPLDLEKQAPGICLPARINMF